MKTIKVAGINVSFDLLFPFDGMDKYETTDSPKYFVKTVDYEFEYKNKTLETKFYDLYDNVQVQKDNGQITGLIKYENNHIYIYMYNKSSELEYLLTQYAIFHIIEKNKMVFMHASSLCYKNIAICLLAKSGTGKSTHARLWKQYSDAYTINDDKQILSIEDGKIYVNSSPWSGKHQIDCNEKHELKFLVFLKQSKINKVIKPNIKEIFNLLMPQISPPSKNYLKEWEEVFDKLLEIKAFILECNMEKEAFEVLNEAILEELK